jgi:hypothetical protein
VTPLKVIVLQAFFSFGKRKNKDTFFSRFFLKKYPCFFIVLIVFNGDAMAVFLPDSAFDRIKIKRTPP